MKNGTADIVYRCKDCSKYNLCRYYHRRKETSQICHYFELQGKTGEWIVTNNKDELYGFLCACSICGNTMVGAYNYCPDCGAKMEVGE